MKIRTARESYTANPFLKVSVYGGSGAGKTAWACRSPRPLVVLSEQQAMATIADAAPDALVVPVETFDEFRDVFNTLKQAPKIEVDGQPALDVQGHAVQTLVVDSFTDLQRMMIADLLGLDRGERDHLDLKSAAPNLSIAQWGRVMDTCTQVWRDQRALACSTVFICLADTQLDSESRRMTVPMLSGKRLPFQMGQFFNAQGVALVQRDAATGHSKHAIRWVADSLRYQAKPAPGWPSVTTNTMEPGKTTLGSLALYSTGGAVAVPHLPGDSASHVQQNHDEHADPDASEYAPQLAPMSSTSDTSDTSDTPAARHQRVRRRR